MVVGIAVVVVVVVARVLVVAGAVVEVGAAVVVVVVVVGGFTSEANGVTVLEETDSRPVPVQLLAATLK